MSAGLTQRQAEVLDFIRDWIAVKQYSPSYQEIADALGMSKPRVYYLIQQLVEREAITMLPKRARSIAVKDGSS